MREVFADWLIPVLATKLVLMTKSGMVCQDRICTTHCGSLARPAIVLDMMRAKASGDGIDEGAYAAAVRVAVADCVEEQVRCGIDVVSGGEQGKIGFFTYAGERLGGFEPRPGRSGGFEKERDSFPEYYGEYFATAMAGATVAPLDPLVCTGPVAYRGQAALERELADLRHALEGRDVEGAFVPAISPSGVGANEHYPTEEEYLFAVADALRSEYRAILDAGFLLQVDDPSLTDRYSYSPLPEAERRRRAELDVEALNHALRGLPQDRIRFHTCYGINDGPRVHDAPLGQIVDLILRVDAGTYSFEAANPRHEHEYHLWETVRLPEGKSLMPGVITHSSNIVEHPELVAERIVRYARLVGRGNVIAGADCGFSSQATYHPEIHPTVVWAKLRALAEGARLATAQLWP